MSASHTDFDDAYFKRALGRFPTGVTIITTEHPELGTPIGLTVSSFNSVSLHPPLIMWALAKHSSSLSLFQHSKGYTVHVLSSRQAELARHFASGTQAERFAGQALVRTPNDLPRLDTPDTAAWFACHNLATHEAGDHVIFIGQVEHCHWEDLPPLVYHGGKFELTPLEAL